MKGFELINQALLDIAERDPLSVFIAQGVRDPNGVFGTLFGLSDKIDEKRLVEMPVAEANGIGIAIGAAINGLRPIVSFHRVEFVLPALEQIFNNAAKANFISGGQYNAQILIRAVIGRGWGQGPCHSQGFENLFSMVPGLKVVCPSLPSTVYNLVKGSYEDPNPVISLEHRWVHFLEADQKPDIFSSKDIKPFTVVKGQDLTLVSYGYMTVEALNVINEFRDAGIFIELIDLQMLRPLELDLIFESVKKTGRLLVVDQGGKFLGLGSEIVAQVVEFCLQDLKSPPIRLGLPSLPSPSSPALAAEYYITSIQIGEAIESLFGSSEEFRTANEKIRRKRLQFPLDVPNQNFQGPF